MGLHRPQHDHLNHHQHDHILLLVPPPTAPFGVYYVCIQCTPYYVTWTITSQTTCRNWTYWISSSLFSVRFPYLYHFYSTHQPLDTIVFQIHEIILFMISVTYYFISMYYKYLWSKSNEEEEQTYMCVNRRLDYDIMITKGSENMTHLT